MAMTINGTSITTFGATLLANAFSNHEVVNVYDWLDGAAQPVYERTEQRFKELNLRFLITGATALATEANFSALMLQLKSCVIKFDEFDKYFACHFEGKVQPDKATPTAYIVEVSLLCSKTYLPEVTESATGVLTKSITNCGAIPAECTITVTPTVDIAEFTISGLSTMPIKLNNLTANQPHVVDGYLIRYLKNGANDIANYNAFAWPVLPTGTTEITFSQSTVTVQVKYYPKFN